jgi:hypothetical protein
LANPRVYRIEDALLNLDEGTWTTKGRNVAAGDRVLIWKAKGADADRGVVALGEVLTDPIPMPSGDDGESYIDPAVGQAIEDRVVVRFVRAPNLPLWLDGLFDAVLRDLSVSRAAGGTIFRVTRGAMGVRSRRGRWVAARWGCASSIASLASKNEPSRVAT